jgi:hypothetical protein
LNDKEFVFLLLSADKRIQISKKTQFVFYKFVAWILDADKKMSRRYHVNVNFLLFVAQQSQLFPESLLLQREL